MKISKYPQKETWSELIKRPSLQKEKLTELIAEIFNEVEKNGDEALIDFSKKYDGSELSELFVTQEEVETAEQLVDSEIKLAIQQAKENITKFHASQTAEIEKIETTKGIICWRENRAVNRQQKVYIL